MKKLLKMLGLYKKYSSSNVPFQCPYDLQSCNHVDSLSMTIDIKCEDCERYNEGIRPSKF